MTQPHRKPFVVCCLACGAQSIAAYTQMPVSLFGDIIKKFHCPWCGAGSSRMTPAATSEVLPPVPDKMADWPQWMKPKVPQ